LSLASPFVLLGGAILAAVLTAGLEYAWYGLATGIAPSRVLAANLHFSYSIRPAWWVLLVGAAVSALPIVRPYIRTGRPTKRVPRGLRTPAE
jgi:sulfoxide reductase heme-binding subunit YedZ